MRHNRQACGVIGGMRDTIDEQKTMLDILHDTIKTMQDMMERGILGKARDMILKKVLIIFDTDGII